MVEYKTRDFAYPLRILQIRRLLEKTQWDGDLLRHVEELKLQAIIKHAYENVPYYRKLFDERSIKPGDIRTEEDLSKLPDLTKDDVRAHFHELIAKNFENFAPTLSHTSGSTGTALEFYEDKFTRIVEFAALWRFMNWTGYRLLRDKFADMSGRVITSADGVAYDRRLRSLKLSSFKLGRVTLRGYVEAIKDFKPAFIRGYPSSLSIFASLIREENVDDIKFKAVTTSSETVLDSQRKTIEDTFGCKLFDYYGQLERVAFIAQCEEGSYHINPEYGAVRIGKLQDVTGRMMGEMICTSLNNYAMPLINYRTRDLCVPSTRKACPCGRELPMVEYIFGRIEDVVVTPEGYHVGRLDAAFKLSQGIELSQILQETSDEVVVKIVKGENYTKQDEFTLLHELRARLGERIRILFSYVDDIPRTEAGKFRFVISKVPLDVVQDSAIY
jgi:phenylacetate-CoA ligase